jgi:predicted RNA binding protein YcfA (HicA-like mRNA interferase family)
LHAVLVALGFSFRPAKGDHRLYYHPRLRYPVGIGPRKPLLPAYVRKALIAID